GWRAVESERQRGYFYHVHQYAAYPDDSRTVIGRTRLPHTADPEYRIASMIQRGSTYGVQFHPEKSGIAGLRLLRNFVELSTKPRPGL
ncbi:MAG TPA: hypothetical protein VFX84_01860, partial [Candidatus Saccharimonadales bacterium]|nr:hypothetical protein [Candidatus Saccharimonadales bacterium]